MRNRVLLYIGGCDSTWPFNTSPVQRLMAIQSEFDRILLYDLGQKQSTFFSGEKFTYFKLNKDWSGVDWSILADKNLDVTVFHGPNWRIARDIFFICYFRRFSISTWAVDLYDHENLTSGIHKANGRYAKFLFHRLNELFLSWAIKKSDVLLSAISEERHIWHKCRVKVKNGVSRNFFDEAGLRVSSGSRLASDELVLCYVGYASFERAGLIYKISQGLKDRTLPCRVVINIFGDSTEDFRSACFGSGGVAVNFLGFQNWDGVLNGIVKSDACLYTFPIKSRPELDCVYPIKLGEYLSAGRYVISVSSSGVNDIFSLVPDLDVRVIDEFDIEKWIEEIESLGVKKKAGQLGFSRANRDFAENYLLWDVVNAEVKRVFER